MGWDIPNLVYSRAAHLRNKIAELDLLHRKGWRLSENDGKWPTLEAFDGESKELHEAIDAHDLENAKEETADVFVTILQVANRLGMSFKELDQWAEYKMRIRFQGAADIDIDNDK